MHDIVVVNNSKYLTEQLKYYYDSIGLGDPNNISNILYNQVNFADSCNFNNVYITVVPKTVSNSLNPTSTLSPAQKELIITSLNDVKTLTTEVVIIDPVYIAVDLCVPASGSTGVTLNDANNTQLQIIKDSNSRRDNTSIMNDVVAVFANYFDRSNIYLGQTLDISALTTSILTVAGVKAFYMVRIDDPAIQYAGLSMIAMNPVYPVDSQLMTKSTSFSYFKYLFLNNKESFNNKITITTSTQIYENVEY